MRELDRVGLDDALRYVLVHADEPDGDYDRVAARWAAWPANAARLSTDTD